MKKKLNKKIVAGILAIAMVLSMMPANQVFAAKKATLSAKNLTVREGKSKTLKVRNAKKKVKWKILDGKKCIKMVKKGKKAVTITGKKRGTATVQATVGKEKLFCVVTVNGKVVVANPNDDSSDTKNENDVAVLNKIIAQQAERGVEISDDLDSDIYEWDTEGRLIAVYWNFGGIKGDISFSELTALQTIECSMNELTSIDVSGCTALKELKCGSNSLTSLNIAGCTALTNLDCHSNNLTALDVSGCTALVYLKCYGNKITKLDLTSCTVLESVNSDDIEIVGYNK